MKTVSFFLLILFSLNFVMAVVDSGVAESQITVFSNENNIGIDDSNSSSEITYLPELILVVLILIGIGIYLIKRKKNKFINKKSVRKR